MAILEARNLAKAYAKRPVVKDVSMSVKQGEIVGLLGPNGAGKTTCFYMIVGLVNQDNGTIIDSDDITARPCTDVPAAVSAICLRNPQWQTECRSISWNP